MKIKKSIIGAALMGSVCLWAGGLDGPVEPIDVTPAQEVEFASDADVDSAGRFERADNNNKIYVGAAAGGMRANGEDSAKGASVSLIAGYTLSDYSKIEARYSRLIADADYNEVTKNITMSNIGVYFKQMLPLPGSFVPYGLLGFGKSSFDKESDTGLQWGVGGSYVLNEKVDLFIDYISYYSSDFGGAYAQDIDFTSVSFGSIYTF